MTIAGTEPGGMATRGVKRASPTVVDIRVATSPAVHLPRGAGGAPSVIRESPASGPALAADTGSRTALQRRTDRVPRGRASAAADALRNWADRFLAAMAMIVLLPVFLVIAGLIKATSRGPVFYVRPRVGLDGELFPFFKFRTMVPGADRLRDEILGDPDEEMAERYRCDPRITRIGAVLRRWSLDELPQLINIVRGEMAIVGPRPMLPDEVRLLDDVHNRRHDCRPGLTGLWQVSGRKETSWEERMDLDLHYVANQSVRQDLAIVRRTFSVVLRGEGAY